MTDQKSKLDTIKTTTGKISEEEKPEIKDSEPKGELDKISYADGKEDEAIQKARDLEKLVNIGEVNPYGTTITGVFEEKVGDMTLVEMQELAVTVGVFPSGTRTSLKNKLLKAFRDYQRGSSSFVVPSSSSICPDADRESDKFKKALGLMKEGL